MKLKCILFQKRNHFYMLTGAGLLTALMWMVYYPQLLPLY